MDRFFSYFNSCYEQLNKDWVYYVYMILHFFFVVLMQSVSKNDALFLEDMWPSMFMNVMIWLCCHLTGKLSCVNILVSWNGKDFEVKGLYFYFTICNEEADRWIFRSLRWLFFRNEYVVRSRHITKASFWNFHFKKM